MQSIDNREAALLGLLSEGPKHPYQIEKDIQDRDMRVWTDLSMSSVYKLLKGLEQRGLVTSQTEISESNRARKIYQLAESGVAALKERLSGLLTAVETRKYPLHVALSNLGLLEVDEARACLVTYRDEVHKAIVCYRELEAYLRDSGCPRHRQHLALHPIYLLEGELRWAEDFIAEVDRTGSLT